MAPPKDPTFENDSVKENIMAEKRLNARIQQKFDTEENWNKATAFIPKAGEIIVYDADATHSEMRFKCGDGTTIVTNLPFLFEKTNIKVENSILVID